MTFPACIELLRDEEVTTHPTALRLYGLLLCDPLIRACPRPIAIGGLAFRLGVSWHRAKEALELLIGAGYLLESGRDDKGVRLVLMPERRAPTVDGTLMAA